MDEIEIDEIADKLIDFTARESGVAVLAHTDASRADLYVDGHRHNGVLTGLAIPGDPMIRLRARRAKYYTHFELISPIAPELLTEMAELYNRLVQARLSPVMMLAMIGGEENHEGHEGHEV